MVLIMAVFMMTMMVMRMKVTIRVMVMILNFTDSERASVKLNAFFQGGHRITKAHGTP